MAAIGEQIRLSRNTLGIIGRQRLIHILGGRALIYMLAPVPLDNLPWLIGLSIDSDGAPGYAMHRLQSDRTCAESDRCMGIVADAAGVVTEVVGTADLVSASKRLRCLETVSIKSTNPALPNRDIAWGLASRFYDAGHTFDPAQVVLHAAMEQVILNRRIA